MSFKDNEDVCYMFDSPELNFTGIFSSFLYIHSLEKYLVFSLLSNFFNFWLQIYFSYLVSKMYLEFLKSKQLSFFVRLLVETVYSLLLVCLFFKVPKRELFSYTKYLWNFNYD